MDPQIPPQETVSQSEVENLLRQIGDAESSPEIPPAGNVIAGPPPEAAEPYAFRRFSTFAPSQLRKLRVRHEGFLRELQSRLSVHLRLEVVLRMSRLDTISFAKFISEISTPTYLAMLEIEPLKGICLLDIPSQLALSMIDRELGGHGTCGEDERALTEIEARILNKVVDITINEWCGAWHDLVDLKPTFVGHENDGAFFQNYTPETAMLVLGFEMQIGELTRQVQFSLPYQALEPIIQKLDAEVRSSEKPDARIPSSPLKWNPVLNEVPIKVTAELPSLKITAKELAKLKPGYVISLDSEIVQHIRLSLAQTPKFSATLGNCGSRWAAKISKILQP